MKSLIIQSPAKVNLFLKIVGRRADGYHLLETLFHRVSLSDTLSLRKTPSGISIQTNDPLVPTDRQNLIAKAFELLKKETHISGGVSVRLTKRIPTAGGMGGGSSNAAHFLLGMKKLYRLRVSDAKLRKMGSKLGADVNFFLMQTTQAIGGGIGDKLIARPVAKKLWFVIITMPKPLSTRKVYQTYAKTYGPRFRRPVLPVSSHFLTKKYPVATLSHYLKDLKEGRKNALLRNDLQEVSAALYPAVGKALRLFEELGVETYLVSGSGPTVFGIVPSHTVASHLAKKIKSTFRPYKQIYIAHTI